MAVVCEINCFWSVILLLSHRHIYPIMFLYYDKYIKTIFKSHMELIICKNLTNLFLHHSMCSCRVLKWGLVSTFLVSWTVRMCLVTVLSSTGKLIFAKGPTNLLCNICLKWTHLSCSLLTRLSRSPSNVKVL